MSRKLSEEKIKQIIQLHHDGLIQKDIGKIVGCDKSTVGVYLRKIGITSNNEAHRLTNHSLYYVWRNIKRRCYNINSKEFKNYGGRGIIMYNNWINSFITFYNFCIENGWEQGLQIDRKDNDGNYTPENCRFVTPFINNHNRRSIWKNNTSKYRNIYHFKKNNKYKVEIYVKGKSFYLGYHYTKKEALEVLNKFIIDNNLQDLYSIQEYHGE